MKNQFIILSLISVFLLPGCGKSSKDTVSPVTDPSQANLTFPLQNSSCTTGTVLSNTQSSITFNWSASANTDSYEIDIKNLLTNAMISQTTITNQLTVTLSRNTPYSWYIVSKSSQSSKTAQSLTWKFYNSGLGITSYPPFPADLISPGLTQNVTATGNIIKLTWSGSDADNNITAYDIYLGTTAIPPLLKSGVTDMFLDNVNVTSGNTYYWKITTKDAQGNTSDSDIYQFKIN